MNSTRIFFSIISLLFFANQSLLAKETVVDFPKIVIENVEVEIQVSSKDPKQKQAILMTEEGSVIVPLIDGKAVIQKKFKQEQNISITVGEEVYEKKITPIPLWWSIFPPLISIAMALAFKEVLSSLLVGIFFGTAVIYCYSDGLYGLVLAFMALIDTYILGALYDQGHLSIIVFSLLIGGMVSIVSKNGGMQGIVNRISKIATSPMKGQLATWFLGVAIFFDDYANTLVVGNTMRPVTDRLRISREKLAYLVDSTAAPVASIAFITTWIGAELSYIESGINNIDGLKEGVYATFVQSLQYSFYPILALLFMLILILKERDFGPMLKAENRARITAEPSAVSISEVANEEDPNKEFQPKEGIPHRAYNAIIPVLIVVLGTMFGLFYTGYDATVWKDDSLNLSRKLSIIIGDADSYLALLWSSMASLFVAIALSISQKIMNLKDSIQTMMNGFNTMLPAILILVLAWALATITEHLHTADFLTSLLSDNVSVYFIPTITFILAAIVAFSTGSSWGTMAILYPLMMPAAWQISQESGMSYDESLSIFHNVVACVLAGSVLGDHCSPISDTTILSSLASSCNHIDHVRTQMPYALTVGSIAILTGTIPSAFGIPMWITLPVSLLILYCIIHFYGKKVEELPEIKF